METILSHHACSRKRDEASKPVIFQNDTNNVDEIQYARLQKKLMEEASLAQEKKLNKANEELQFEIADKEEVKRQRDQLLAEKEGLNQLLKQKEAEIEDAKTKLQAEVAEKGTAQKKCTELSAESDELRKRNNSLTQDVGDLSTSRDNVAREKDELKSLRDALQKKLPNGPQENCLPLNYDGATVMIVNLGSQMALDAGKDGGDRAHAWSYHVDNTNQIFTLHKVLSDAGYWVIRRKSDGKNLYYPNGNTDVDVHVGSGIPGKQDYWFIGRGSDSRVGSWVIKNAEWNTYIELAGSSRENGTRIKSYSFSNNMDANWVIIPFIIN